MIQVSSPTRVDLAGGTLDMWPLFLFVPKAVTVNVAISIQTHVTLSEEPSGKVSIHSLDYDKKFEFSSLTDFRKSTLPELHYYQKVVEYLQIENGFHLQTKSESPIGGGLGGSSSLLVSLMKAFYQLAGKAEPSVTEFARIAHNIEARILLTPTGTQDYIPAIQGGLNLIDYAIEGISVEQVAPDAQWSDRFLLVYTGRSHHSGLNNFEVLKQAVGKDQKTLGALKSLSEISLEMADACRKRNWDLFGDLFEREYHSRLELTEAFSSPEIRQLKQLALTFGIKSVKICGAGGGGCVLIWCDSLQQKTKVEEQCRKEGFSPLQVRPQFPNR